MTEQKTYLGDRTKYFGASDMPALRGNDDFTTREQLIAKKKGDLISYIEDTHYIDRGNKYEDQVYHELSLEWYAKGVSEAESQKTFIKEDIKAKAHLDGYFVEYEGNKMIVHIYEVKTKTVDTKTDFNELANFFKANPPVKYLDQMELQYALAKYNLDPMMNCEIEFKMHLIMGLYRGRSNDCTGSIEIDVTDIITSIDPQDVFDEIANFWAEKEKHDGFYSAETMLEIERNKMKSEFASRDINYQEIQLEQLNDVTATNLCHGYINICDEVASLDKALKEAKKEKDNYEKQLISQAKRVSKINHSDFTIEFDRGVDNGRYTSAKEASYTSPKEYTKIKIKKMEL